MRTRIAKRRPDRAGAGLSVSILIVVIGRPMVMKISPTQRMSSKT